MKFDRILCDVPCSGDGTLRKNLDVWMKWNTANGSSLHGYNCLIELQPVFIKPYFFNISSLQYRIARRGAEMLALNGKMVYSTCSLNPMEDEAVIHRLLVESKGSLELEEVGEKLPGLKFCRGLSNWVVMSRELVTFTDPEQVPEALKSSLRPALFPPKQEDAAKFHLDRW